MPAKPSMQQWLTRNRPPRVQITYDVETGGAIEKKELPLVVGILADMGGKQNDLPKSMKERKFIEIDRDNFDTVMKSIRPRLTLSVKNRMSDAGGSVTADLVFTKMSDFRPEALVNPDTKDANHHVVGPLQELYQARTALNDLLAKIDGEDKLTALLKQVAQATESDQKSIQTATEVTNV